MNKLKGLWSYIDGKKTYGLCALALLWSLVGYYMGWLDSTTAMEMTWASLTGGAFRHAIQ